MRIRPSTPKTGVAVVRSEGSERRPARAHVPLERSCKSSEELGVAVGEVRGSLEDTEGAQELRLQVDLVGAFSLEGEKDERVY